MLIRLMALGSAVIMIQAACSRHVPMICEASLSSAAAGKIAVSRIDHSSKLPFIFPDEIVWYPPSLGSSIEFVIGYDYNKKNSEVIGPFSGGHIQFTLSSKGDGEYSALISAIDGNWRFHGKDIGIGDQQAAIVLEPNDPRVQSIMQSINIKQKIKIEVLKGNTIIASEIYDTSGIIERDQLFKKAVHLVNNTNSNVCKPI